MTTMIKDSEVIAQVCAKLHEKNPQIAQGVIDRVVRAEFAPFVGRPVRDYLSVLTERAAKDHLKKLTGAGV